MAAPTSGAAHLSLSVIVGVAAQPFSLPIPVFARCCATSEGSRMCTTGDYGIVYVAGVAWL
jgi:hypothetical protein